MNDLTTTNWELIGVILALLAILGTMIVCFAKLNFWLGERSRDIDAIRTMAQENKADLKAHDTDCGRREKELQGDLKEIRGRLADGATRFATLEQNSEFMKGELREIKEAVKK